MEKLLYKGKLLNLYRRITRLPNGFKATLEVVRHPGAALIVPFLSQDTIIILRQYRPVINAYLYELPAGTLGKNEQSRACARREIIEETGFAAKKITRIGEIVPVPGYSTEKILIFKAKNLTKVSRKTEADEVIRVLILSKPRIKRLFKQGRIKDAKTIAALAMVGWL